MLRAHSFLWHYLWVAPNIVLLALSFLIWRRKQVHQIPAFFAFAILSSLSELAVYAADVLPSVNPYTYWQVNWAGLVVESVLKLVLIGEIFASVFGSYAAIARLGKTLIRGVSVVLLLAAVAAAAYAPPNNPNFFIYDFHLLEQTVYFVESGLLAFIFAFAFYFHLIWDRHAFGITLGLSISSCVHLASWAILDNLGLPEPKRIIFVFLNMATYHAVVLMWFYYLLVPAKENTKHLKPLVPLPENNLEVWNRELERLIQL
jgi:hypothetical protein